MRSLWMVAFTTISLANSMPGACRSSASTALALEPAQTAVEIAARAAEEHAADRAQHRVAEISVQWRHRPRRDAAEKPVAHDELIAGTQLLDETFQTAEIVAVVGIAHDHVAAARGTDAAEEGTAVALLGNRRRRVLQPFRRSAASRRCCRCRRSAPRRRYRCGSGSSAPWRCSSPASPPRSGMASGSSGRTARLRPIAALCPSCPSFRPRRSRLHLHETHDGPVCTIDRGRNNYPMSSRLNCSASSS